MAIVPHITDPKREEINKRISQMAAEGDSDTLLAQHNIRVPQKDKQASASGEQLRAAAAAEKKAGEEAAKTAEGDTAKGGKK